MDIDATIPALTIRQPWADAVIDGLKDCENRTWRISYRGPIWIHSSKKTDKSDRAVEMCEARSERIVGHLIGWVNLVDIVRGHPSKWAFPDHWHWLLTEPVRLEDPIPATGNSALWYPGR